MITNHAVIRFILVQFRLWYPYGAGHGRHYPVFRA